MTYNPFNNHDQVTPFYSFADVVLTKGAGLAKRTSLPMEKLDTVACPIHKDVKIPITRIMPHDVGHYTTECMETLPYIRRTVVQQLMKTIIKVKHGCRLECLNKVPVD